MKKFFVIALIAVFGTALFFACEKEDKNVSENQIETYGNLDDILNMSEDEYNAYVSDLMEKTGIDIYKLSDIAPVKQLVNSTIASFNYFANENQPKYDLSEEVINRMRELADSIQMYYNLGQEYEALTLYQNFCQICNSIPGFSVNTGNYGVQTISFDGHIVDFPTDYLQAETNQAQAVINGISECYPSYNSLSPSTQVEVLAASLVVKIKEDIAQTKQTSDRDACFQAAREDLAIGLASATAVYEGALLACGAAGASVVAAPIVPSCVAVASASYGISCATCWWLYKRAIRRC